MPYPHTRGLSAKSRVLALGPEGSSFEWVDCSDEDDSVLSHLRRDGAFRRRRLYAGPAPELPCRRPVGGRHIVSLEPYVRTGQEGRFG